MKINTYFHLAHISILQVNGKLIEYMYNVQCTKYNVQCTMYKVQCTMYNVQCRMYNVQCTMYNVQCTLNIIPHLLFVRHNLGLGELVEAPAALEHEVVAEDELLDGALLGHVEDPEPVLLHLLQAVRSLRLPAEGPGPRDQDRLGTGRGMREGGRRKEQEARRDQESLLGRHLLEHLLPLLHAGVPAHQLVVEVEVLGPDLPRLQLLQIGDYKYNRFHSEDLTSSKYSKSSKVNLLISGTLPPASLRDFLAGSTGCQSGSSSFEILLLPELLPAGTAFTPPDCLASSLASCRRGLLGEVQ